MLKKILRFPGQVIGFFIGKFSWTPPVWATAINKARKKAGKKFWIVLACLMAMLIGYQYYESLPGPILIEAAIDVPDLTANVENPVPDNLEIEFNYDYSSLKAGQRQPEGEPSVARIDLVNKVIKEGIRISPAIPGEWRWQGDRRLVFKPQQDWPARVYYTVDVDKSIFSEDTLLKDDSYSFTTQPFIISIQDLEFYQDPRTPSVRKVVTTLTFSHPVDKDSLLENMSMTMRPSGSGVDAMAKKFDYTVEFDKNQREAYVHSVPIQLPNEPNYMKLAVDEGVKPAIGGKSSGSELEKQVLIPSVFSFLKISESATRIVPNEEEEPEQLLMLGFTDFIAEEELLVKLSVYLLPEYNPLHKNSRYWQSPREVTSQVLADAEKVDISLIPNEHDSAKNYSFRYDAPENRYIYVRIESGLRSVNNFVKNSIFDNVFAVPKYPKQVKIVGEGSILANSGDHKLSMLARGHKYLKVSVGKVLPGQISHLVSQTSGDINDPHFRSYTFDKENLVEFHEEIITLRPTHPKEANYSSIDLSRFLSRSSGSFGLFFMKVIGWDKEKNEEVYGETDERLIMITDLGILVKNNSDESHDVFVQSIKNGSPVDNARVELLGLNGIPLYSAATKTDGHVSFASTRDFKNEKKPSVYVVRTAGDISFIPFDRSSRQINYSNYDVGGVSSDTLTPDKLSAYAFTDRGIYRPGEKVRAGIIVKKADLSNIEDIPLELVVKNPRNIEARVEKTQLPEKGFIDFSFDTDQTSETGAYKLYTYLVRENGHRGRMLGSVGFRVEEFQPDTLKMESRLVGADKEGWYTDKDIRAEIKLENLFGTPAQDRKVTGRIKVHPAGFSFKKYKDYFFYDPFTSNKEKPLSIDEDLDDTRTDDEGRAAFEIALDRFDKGTYILDFATEGFEPDGGRSVSAKNRVMISPLPYLLGYKSDGKLDYINKGTQRSLELIAVDHKLVRLAKPGLSTKLIEIRHVSTLVKQKNGTYKYQTVTKEKELASGSIDITATGTKHVLPTDLPGDFAYEIYGESGLLLSRIKFTVVGHGNLTGNLEKNAELRLKLDKKDYEAGETIEMNITAPYTGAGLITIESDRVHAHKWFKTSTTATMQTIRVPDGLEGSAYLNVAFIRSADSKEIFTSPLSYAVAPFSIDRSKREIEVDLKVPDLVEPGHKMKISYTSSRPARMVVFAVDEGILQVAKYKTPAPLDHFLRKRSLGVTTLQILDLILPDFDLVKTVSASGGGERARRALAKNLNPFARATDAPAVFWSGIVEADNSERQVSFVVPDYFAGTMRVMAVAVSDEAMGVKSASSLVRGPFVISPNVLTQVAPGDIFTATVGIANTVEGSGPDAMVDVEIIPSEQLEIVGKRKVTMKIGEGSEGKASFEVKARKKLGPSSLRFLAGLGQWQGQRTASLSVRPAVPYQTSFVSGVEDDGKVKLQITRKLYPDLAEQKAAASVSPLVLVDGLSSYLEKFPHGCTEQIVSQVFPLVGLMAHPGFEPHSKKVHDRFDLLINRLRSRQLAGGGFSFWPGDNTVAEYPSVYVMHFLIEARNLGYSVPTNMLERGKDFLTGYAGKPSYSLAEARVRANAIYLLTRLGSVTTNYLVDLQSYLENSYSNSWKKDLAAVYMAATYQLLQKSNEAEDLISHYEMGDNRDLQYGDFHSILTRDAQYVYILANHFEPRLKDIDGEDLLRFVTPVFQGEYNTISAAYSILALGAYSKSVANGVVEKVEFTVTRGKNGSAEKLPGTTTPFPATGFDTEVTGVNITSPEAIFYVVSQAGFNTDLPEKDVRNGLEITREYLNENGDGINSSEQGREITVRLRIRALDGKYVSNVAVVDLLPGGFEVVRDSVPRTAYGWRADYVDVREDRVVFYGDFDTSLRELTYKVKLTSAGKFVVPPAYAASMYDRSVRSVSKAGKFTVNVSQ